MGKDRFLYNLRRFFDPKFDIQEYDKEYHEKLESEGRGFGNYKCPYCNSIISRECYNAYKHLLKTFASHDSRLSHNCTHELQDGEIVTYTRISYTPEPHKSAIKIVYMEK